MKPKVGLVRGHYFSAEETKLYEPLTDEFDITFVSSAKGSAGRFNNVGVVEAPCLDGLLDTVGLGGSFRKVGGMINNTVGLDPEIVLHLRRVLQGFDIVHTIDYDFVVTYQLAKIKKEIGFKLAATHWENIPFVRDSKPLCKLVKYKVYDLIDAFFAMSERAKASLILEGVNESKIFLAGYAVDTKRFKPDVEAGKAWRKRFDIHDDEIVILFVGRVRGAKGIFELIYASKRLLMDRDLQGKKFRVVVAGRGPRDEEVARMAERLGLSDNILHIGYVDHTRIHEVHNMADIFCLPSIPRKYWQEQMGLVFLEAMASGKPVVSTISGSIPEVIGDAGVLVQPNDHMALYEALKNLILSKDARDYLVSKGKKRVEENYTIEKNSQNIRQMFRNLLAQRAV